MPPSKGNPKGTAHSRKPGSGNSRQVKPAIPLPHVKRQAAAAAAAAAASTPKDAGSPGSEKKNGEIASAVLSNGNDASSPANGSVPSPVPASNGNGVAQASPNGDSRGVEAHASPTGMSQRRRFSSDKTSCSRFAGGSSAGTTPAPRPSKSRPSTSRPSKTPVRQHMPPEFRPANPSANPPANVGAGTTDDVNLPHPAPLNGYPYTHNSHPSNGNIQFGIYDGSAGSSPAPPLPGTGIAPPPRMQHADAQQLYMAHAAPGFPTTMTPGLEIMAAGGFDTYTRAGIAYPSMDPYQQYGNGFPPSTPQSFPDSQSSAPPEVSSAMYQKYGLGLDQAGQTRFGDNGVSQTAHGAMHGEAGYSSMPPEPSQPSWTPPREDAGGLLELVQSHFGNPEFADCVLELRLASTAPPIRIHGHRMFFSRSPVLANQLRRMNSQPTPPTLVLEAHDGWIRPDSFYMACQQLYGLPLLPMPPPAHADNMSVAGSKEDRFNFALSYAASGHSMGWSPVVRRGCEIAAQFISLDTIEAAMGFVMDQYEDRGSHETLKYGQSSHILLHAIVDLLASSLPPNFQLDPSVSSPRAHSRLPYDLPPPPKPKVASDAKPASDANPGSPIITWGNHQAHRSKPSRSGNSLHIQFGDLSMTNGSDGSGESNGPHLSNGTLSATLSRVLINLPFGYLKILLESGMHGWSGAETRLAAVRETVRERESRRTRALEAVNSGGVPDHVAIKTSLGSPEPPLSTPWTVLGWQEEVVLPSSRGGPSLTRQWAPLKKTQGDATSAAYP